MVGDLIVQQVTNLGLSLGLNLTVGSIFNPSVFGSLVKFQIDNFSLFKKEVLEIKEEQKQEIKLDVQRELTKEDSLLIKRILQKVFEELEEEKIRIYARIFYESVIDGNKEKILHLDYIFEFLKDLRKEHFLILKWYYESNWVAPNMIGSEFDNKRKTELPIISREFVVLESDLYIKGLLYAVQIDAYQNNRFCLSSRGKEIYELLKTEILKIK